MLNALLRLESDRRSILFQSIWFCTKCRMLSRVVRLSKLIPQQSSKSHYSGRHSIEDIQWALGVLHRHYKPQPSCLILSLTGAQLLARYGHPFTVNIGVSKEEDFHAHAWLSSGHQAIWGSDEGQSFTAIGELSAQTGSKR